MLGSVIKDRREELHMTQDVLAKKSGLSRQTISAIERGKNTNVLVGTLSALATALDTSVDDFLRASCPKDLTPINPLDYYRT